MHFSGLAELMRYAVQPAIIESSRSSFLLRDAAAGVELPKHSQARYIVQRQSHAMTMPIMRRLSDLCCMFSETLRILSESVWGKSEFATLMYDTLVAASHVRRFG